MVSEGGMTLEGGMVRGGMHWRGQGYGPDRGMVI